MPTSLAVLIVCPHRIVRDGLTALAERDEDLRVAGSAADTAEALELLEDVSPDVLLVGYGWEDRECLRVVERLRSERPDVPVLVLSAERAPEHVQATLGAGAQGYLPLDVDLDELVRALLTVARGEVALHSSLVPELLAWMASEPGKRNRGPSLDDLTRREREILTLLTRGLGDRDIAQELFISVRTVQTHLSHIYQKLDVHSRTEAALIAVREGWVSLTDNRTPDP